MHFTCGQVTFVASRLLLLYELSSSREASVTLCLLKSSYLGSQGHNDMLASIAILCAGVPHLHPKSGPVLPLLNYSTILYTACLPATATRIFLTVAFV